MSFSHQRHERFDSQPSVYASGDEIEDVEAESRLASTAQRRKTDAVRSDDDSAYGSDDLAEDHLLPVELRDGDSRRVEQDGASLQTAKAPLQDSKPVSWLELPNRTQLIILALIRLAEPITQTSLQSYMFYMLKSFDGNLTDSDISAQVGYLAAGFTGAQAVTGMIWGALADKEWMGRKRIVLIGLLGTLVSTVGFGFSRSFFWAMVFRTLNGALNGNVGVLRTMISEIVVEKKYQPKAFLMLPLTFNVGVLIGPILGGWLQDPTSQYPAVFPKGGWLEQYPYALPNVFTSVFLLSAAVLVVLGLKETHFERKHRPDWGLTVGSTVGRFVSRLFRAKPTHSYVRLEADDSVELEPASRDPGRLHVTAGPVRRAQLPFNRIFTRNVVLTLLTHSTFALNMGVFDTLWFIFLSTPRFDLQHPDPPNHKEQKLPFSFTGGLGLPPPTIGLAISAIGVFGLCMQFGIYSRVTHALGVLRTFRLSSLVFPITYTLAPFLVMLPMKSAAPHAADGPWIWLGMLGLLAIQVTGRTFTLPITTILVNNCSPHPSVLGTIHGMGSSASATARTFGPIVWTVLYGAGLKKGVVGLAWWALVSEAIVVPIIAQFIYEGDGHEIRLEGDA